MVKIAVTGGIGSGKTTVLNWFEARSIPTISADQISRDLVTKGQLGLVTIVDFFGKEVLNSNGDLKRDYIRDLIFSNLDAKQAIEKIMHPLIHKETIERLKILEQENHRVVVIEIPLLAEVGRPDYIDLVWVLECSEKTQIERVRKRSQLSEKYILNIIRNQATVVHRKKTADLIINSDIKMLKLYNILEKELEKTLGDCPYLP